MAPEMKPVTTRARKTTSFTWYGDADTALREQTPQWPDLESTASESADDVMSDVVVPAEEPVTASFRPGTPAVRASYESDMSDVGECDDRRRFRNSLVKVSYDSDSCLTPRSRRTLRRTLSSATEPWPSVNEPPPKPALDTIFSPTHEILHPLQSLRLERSFSQRAGSNFPERAIGRSGRISKRINPEGFTLPNPEPSVLEKPDSAPPSCPLESIDKPSSTPELVQSAENLEAKPSPKPRFTPVKFESYAFPEQRRNSAELEKPQLYSMDFVSYRFAKRTLEEEKREQKQSLIRSNFDKDEEDEEEEGKATETALAPNIVVIIVDAEKKLTFVALDWAINVAVRPGDEIVVLGVLKHILSPMGYKMLATTDPLYGVDREVLQLQVDRMTETFQGKLSDSGRAEECEKKKVKLTVRIAPGARVRTVVVRELEALGATYAIFDRRAMRSRRYYEKHLSCHAVRMRRNGRSTKTITLVPPRARSSPITSSDISSVSSSMSTDRASSESTSPTTFWRRITSFRSSRRSRSRSASNRLDAVSPDAFAPEAAQDLKMMFQAPPKTRVSADAFSYKKGMESRRKNLPAMSVTIPPPICAA